ncbi:hypothetical protein AJ88_22240 [Mesorhizobium amorphae CCBAU 01583]|nr:hypothetical protein AJ88_22240 [Mesorhizobium amorphae CCBAU 01583]
MVLPQQVEKMRPLGRSGLGQEADRVLGLYAGGGDQGFEVPGKIALSANIACKRPELFLNHLIIEGEDLLPLGNQSFSTTRIREMRPETGAIRGVFSTVGRMIPALWAETVMVMSGSDTNVASTESTITL